MPAPQDTTLSLKKIELPDKHIVDGEEFPKAFFLDGPENRTLEDSKELVSKLASQGFFQNELNKHGAVLLRGLIPAGETTADSFSKLIYAIETPIGSRPYVQIGLAGQRHLQAPNVHSANEGAHDRRFYQHSEYARYPVFPDKIHFYAAQVPPAGCGGETPVGNNREVYEAVAKEIPEFLELQEKHGGLTISQRYPARGHELQSNKFSWAGEDSFGQDLTPEEREHVFVEGNADDEALFQKIKPKVEKRARKLGEFTWENDKIGGSLTLVMRTPAIRDDPYLHKPVWFNGLIGRYGHLRDEPDGKESIIAFYDGTAIPKEMLDAILALSLRLEYIHEWEAGDILLVDNYRASHGRLGWKAGYTRKILVSMWDNANTTH